MCEQCSVGLVGGKLVKLGVIWRVEKGEEERRRRKIGFWEKKGEKRGEKERKKKRRKERKKKKEKERKKKGGRREEEKERRKEKKGLRVWCLWFGVVEERYVFKFCFEFGNVWILD